MEMLYLSKKDIRNMGVSMMERIIEAVGEGLRLKGLDKVQMPPKSEIRPVPDSFLHAMPVYIEGSKICGMKWMSGYRSNVDKNLPYINGLLVLSDAANGIPMAVMDCSEITALRTGAMVGIAAKHLARSDRSVVGFLGCGVQARNSLIALMNVMPKLSLVRCYDVSQEAAANFVNDMEGHFPLASFVICDSPGDMAHFSDVVVTATPIVDKPKPSMDAGMLKEGALAIALDYDAAWTPAAMCESDKIVVDDVEQLMFTKQQGKHFGSMPKDSYIDLGDIVANIKPGRENDTERILCMNLGIAVSDIVTAKLFYDSAIKKGVGLNLPL
jgi:ornithine cyclodeaminase/alanine dehydrogenase-like protein (mu-crystallin family)